MNNTGLDSTTESGGKDLGQVTVDDLYRTNQPRLQLELLAGKAGLHHVLQKPRIQKSGLALAGFTSHIDPSKIQILGETEINYLETLTPQEREDRLHGFCASQVPCFVVTKGLDVPRELIEISRLHQIPLLRSPQFSSRCIKTITSYLEEVLARRITRSGVLVDVYGVGVLILGKSGIGKSECALDLIDRGHRLVTDDVVVLKKKDPETLVGSSPDLTRQHMEIRGLGIINIRHLYGVSSIQAEKDIDLVVELIDWSPKETVERLGLDEETYGILDVMKPYLRMPVRPGRNMALILEVAAKNHLLKRTGLSPAHRFERQLLDRMHEQQEE